MARKMKGAVNNLKHDDLHQVANDRVSFKLGSMAPQSKNIF